MVYGGSYVTVIFHFYRLRCGKVIFSQASVILFTGRGGVAATPPDTHPSDIHPIRQTHPLGRHTPRAHPPRQTHPWAHTPLDRHTTPGMATAADGTHPTGMHSCNKVFWEWWPIRTNQLVNVNIPFWKHINSRETDLSAQKSQDNVYSVVHIFRIFEEILG